MAAGLTRCIPGWRMAVTQVGLMRSLTGQPLVPSPVMILEPRAADTVPLSTTSGRGIWTNFKPAANGG